MVQIDLKVKGVGITRSRRRTLEAWVWEAIGTAGASAAEVRTHLERKDVHDLERGVLPDLARAVLRQLRSAGRLDLAEGLYARTQSKQEPAPDVHDLEGRAEVIDGEVVAVIITVPVPPAALNPNARCHWSAKAPATRLARQCSAVACREGLGSLAPPRWEKAVYDVEWHYAARQLDQDNAIRMLKATRDGLTDAGVIEDDRHLLLAEWSFEKSRKPRVVLTIRPGDGRGASGHRRGSNRDE